jgi:hypothetical protein
LVQRTFVALEIGDELVHAYARLLQDAAQPADRQLAMEWHGAPDLAFRGRSLEDQVAPALAHADETQAFKGAHGLLAGDAAQLRRTLPRMW